MITAVVGEVVDLALASTPTTGYQWQHPSLPPGLELLGSEFVPGPAQRPGSGGAQHFLLCATAPGRFRIEFELRRAWDAHPVDTRIFELEITE